MLHVRFIGPQGMHVTLYPGQAPARDSAAPVAVGLRTGYVYRVRLHGMSEFPGVALYPSLEVRGSLELPPSMNAAEFPAPITLTEADIRSVQAGTLVTKVIYLENPERATPAAAEAGQVLEANVPSNRDLLDESRQIGRPMAILRIGERSFTDEELATESIAGTILLPGESVLGRPGMPPCLQGTCVKVYDPTLGRRCPEEECFHDGGDVGLPAGIRPDGKLGGLDPTDTLAEFTDSAGRRAVVKSNRICICAPRFAVLRHEMPVAGYDSALSLGSTGAVHGRVELRIRQPSLESLQANLLAEMKGRQRPSGTQNYVSLVELDNAVRIAAIGRIDTTDVVGAVLEKPTQQLPGKPLVLCKWASAQAAQAGDVITFYLKYSNVGGQPIGDVVVSDSLSGRLEYVPGTARSERDAVFTTQENEAGSLILRWEVSGKLLPGTSAVVSFQARVR
jgi:uncharacterized repeat protein (TIGR01451 family)